MVEAALVIVVFKEVLSTRSFAFFHTTHGTVTGHLRDVVRAPTENHVVVRMVRSQHLVTARAYTDIRTYMF